MSKQKTHIQIVSKEEFAKVVLDPEKSFEERKLIIIEEMGIDIDPEINDGDDLLNTVYDVYLNMVNEYQLLEEQSYIKKKKEKRGSIKDGIIEIIQEKMEISFHDLIEETSEKYADNYKNLGKTPRTRVRNTVKDLEAEHLIKVYKDDSVKMIKWLKMSERNG